MGTPVSNAHSASTLSAGSPNVPVGQLVDIPLGGSESLYEVQSIHS
jgi:hypothetical protein